MKKYEHNTKLKMLLDTGQLWKPYILVFDSKYIILSIRLTNQRHTTLQSVDSWQVQNLSADISHGYTV